jgi:hypothetical protein
MAIILCEVALCATAIGTRPLHKIGCGQRTGNPKLIPKGQRHKLLHLGRQGQYLNFRQALLDSAFTAS